ncbi:MAG: hypothetical protein ACJAT2_001977 [Bacteriovoracaceae bacterium]|jgi:hypothetical protein
MNQTKALILINKQILQIESYLWDQGFENQFRIKRLAGEDWELLSWKPLLSRFRLTYTKIASFEQSGGIPEVEIPLAEADDELKLKIGPHLESFMKRFFKISKTLNEQTKDLELFSNYLGELQNRIQESGQEIRRVANAANA